MATLDAFARKHGITYPLLSDQGSRTIDAWGIRNQHAIGRAAGIPYPGTFVLDRRGIVVTRSFEEAYEERATAASILATMRASEASSGGAEVAGRYLTVRVTASDPVAATGQHVTLMAEITPGPHVHVYAPGQRDYVPVSLNLEASDEFRAAETWYPQPSPYVFAPLDETVQVYAGPFRLSRDIMVALTRDVRRRGAAHEILTIRGTLSYQACDDRICFPPDTVPLTWTIELAPLEPR